MSQESIDYGWQEVQRTASVMSLSTLDDEDLYDDSRSNSPNPTTLLREPSQPSPDPTFQHISWQAAVSTMASTENSTTLPIRTGDASDNVTPTNETDLMSSFQNPEVYHKACYNTHKVSRAVIQLIEDLGGLKVSTLAMMDSTCRDLCLHLKEMEPMLAAFTKHCQTRGSNMALTTLPLTPGLLDWLVSVESDLLKALRELQGLKHGDDDTGLAVTPMPASIPLVKNMTFSDLVEDLDHSRSTIKAFLPILRADFDEFQTKFINFPTGPSRNQSRKEPPNSKVSSIRIELYALKDRTRMISTFLCTLCTHGFPDLPGLATAIKALDGLFEIMSTILTNNGTEWIESESTPCQQRTISYPQFLELDPEVLKDVTLHLTEFHEELDLPEWPASDWFTPAMVRNHQVVCLTEGGQLQELLCAISFLEDLLTIR